MWTQDTNLGKFIVGVECNRAFAEHAKTLAFRTSLYCSCHFLALLPRSTPSQLLQELFASELSLLGPQATLQAERNPHDFHCSMRLIEFMASDLPPLHLTRTG